MQWKRINKQVNKIIVLKIFLVLSFASVATQAGIDWVGNGGNIVSCENKDRLELFDYHEGRNSRGISVFLGSPELNWKLKIEYALIRLSGINPSRAKLYKHWLDRFEEETNFFENGYIPAIPDSGGIVLPIGCKLIQVASQRPSREMMPGDKRYLIDRYHWDKLDEDTKAGLVLHELIYREGIENGHMSSVRVRYFNQMISSDNIYSFSQKNFLSLVKLVGLRYLDYSGYNVDLWDASFHSNGGVHSAWVSKIRSWVTFSEDGVVLKISPNGELVRQP